MICNDLATAALDWAALGASSRAARRSHTNPYEEKAYRGPALKEVQAWWEQCKEWMSHFKGQSAPLVFDFKSLLKDLSGKAAEAHSDVDAFMEHCAKWWQTREGTYLFFWSMLRSS